MASELIVLPTAYRHGITEDQIRHALTNVVDVFVNEGDIPLTIITGAADPNTELIVEVGFEVSDSGNVVVYHRWKLVRSTASPESHLIPRQGESDATIHKRHHPTR